VYLYYVTKDDNMTNNVIFSEEWGGWQLLILKYSGPYPFCVCAERERPVRKKRGRLSEWPGYAKCYASEAEALAQIEAFKNKQK
jgi:hypothetical protein